MLGTRAVVDRNHASQIGAARAQLAREVTRSNAIEKSVSLREDSATRAMQRAEAASVAARNAESRAQAARARFDSLSSAASPVCAPIVAAGRQALAASDAVNHALAADTTELRSVIVLKQRSIDELRPQLDSLRNAAVAVSNASQPSLLSRLLPHIGAGVTAGVDVQGRPNAVAGITFGWTF